MYHLKILQLVGIREYKHNYYLQVNVQFEKEETFYWEVDQQTATSLHEVTDFTKGYHYRLSLRTYLDKSTVTRTMLEQSNQLEFTCSDDYACQLARLKRIDCFDKVDTLPFLSKELAFTPIEENAQQAELTSSEPQAPAKVKRKFSWLLATAFAIICAIIFTYTGHSILTMALAQPEKVADKQEITIEETPLKESIEPKPETTIQEETITIDENPAIPFFELGDGTSHSVPEGKVALTFDDGPSSFTKEIIDILIDSDAGGTFFLVGSNVAKYPENTEYIHKNGYSIGSHSMNHINFASSGANTQQEELLQSSELIEAITGEDVTLFRPPFGQMNNTTEQLTADLGQRIILWNNDPRDWQSRNANKIIQHIKSTEVSGSIILLHETKATLEALPKIIAYLKEQNLELVTLR
ncbi:polysaccharide deacetylase family protein [Paucisalibacillus globulus]|uniref:polysaccharide deacetylase family protein n=1 Tax=Paucisalibacillus globulus TaxID=351095 RepID=UPI0006842F44|nr:polysaccharide deacetylase family protein [Paucisalibacillus globulus]